MVIQILPAKSTEKRVHRADGATGTIGTLETRAHLQETERPYRPRIERPRERESIRNTWLLSSALVMGLVLTSAGFDRGYQDEGGDGGDSERAEAGETPSAAPMPLWLRNMVP
jgi:hypothetical protein